MTRLTLLRVLNDRRGAAVIELALVAPVLALTVIGIVDVSNAYSRKLALEQGAQRAIEKIMQTTETSTVENTLKTEAVCQVNGMTNGVCNTTPITASNVTVTYRLECKNATSGAINSTTSTTDSAAFDALACSTTTEKEQRYLEVNVVDKYYPLFPIHFASFTSADGSYHISATAGMRTE